MLLSGAATATTATAATPASASSLTGLDGAWACSVPTGYVYDQVTQSTQCSSGSWTAPRFHLRTPVDGLTACTIPSGFTYSATTQNTDCSYNQGSPSTRYLLLG
ncbi:hypothetical protein ACGFZP_31035 [Kitasatospora sp. NPDC048239]|uniref:hypothetical protein n=1 Tax=Kitasatospora sp. NPDC048239 TaxID=3364046 RepID=UPI00371F77C2